MTGQPRINLLYSWAGVARHGIKMTDSGSGPVVDVTLSPPPLPPADDCVIKFVSSLCPQQEDEAGEAGTISCQSG